MVTIDTYRQLVLKFPEVYEAPHFDKASFRVKKKIFTTLDTVNNQACIRLSEIDQNVFSSYNKAVFFPVPNKWGKLGWTFVNLKKVKKTMLVDALTTSYCEIAPKKLSALVRTTENEE
jgi:predicted DNA-binding protein (MmcQ/YjbR family)